MIDFSVGSSGFFTQNITVLYNGHIDTATGTIYQSSQVLEYVSQIVLSEDETAETTYVYEYDENGNITVITDENEIIQRKYYYDDLGQLVREDNRALGKTCVWTYDNAGNIKSKKTYAFTTGTLGSVQGTQSYTYGNSAWKDLLTKIGDYEITYDAIGNPTEIIADYDGDIEGMYLTWEDGRKLVHVEGIALYHEGDYTLDFTYNVDGIRTSKTYLCEYDWNGYRIEYIVDGSRIISETCYTYNFDDDIWEGEVYSLVYIYDELGSPIGMMYRTPSHAQGVYDCFFFDKNLQGDIVGIYNASGTKVVSYAYDAWGNCTESYPAGYSAASAAMRNPFRYRGYYYDTETKWYYLQSRYYNPSWGRFINGDALLGANGGLVGFNLFAYCNNCPVTFFDANGQCAHKNPPITDCANCIAGIETPETCSYPQMSGQSGPTGEDVGVAIVSNATGPIIDGMEAIGKYAVRNASRPSNIGLGQFAKNQADDLAEIAFTSKSIAGFVNVVGLITDVCIGIGQNVEQKSSFSKIVWDMQVDGTFFVGSFVSTTFATQVGTYFGTLVSPGFGTVCGMVIGFTVGMTISYFVDLKVYKNGKTGRETVKAIYS